MKIALTFVLFMLTGSIVEAADEVKCRDLAGLVEGLESHGQKHTLLRGAELDVFVQFIEQGGGTFNVKPDYALRVDLTDRPLTVLAFGSGDKVCDLYVMPAATASALVGGA